VRRHRRSTAIPPELDILAANIAEVPPIDPSYAPARQIVFTIEVAGAPVCLASTRLAWYGFMIDADKSHATGVTTPAFESLGVDAQIVARCDPASGTFTSAAGTVTVSPGLNGTGLVQISTTAALLPSVDFLWVAFAENGTEFTRLPHEPDVQSWTTTERSLF
jgi:hypothetical protein